MTDDPRGRGLPGRRPRSVRTSLALVLATTTFLALMVFGLGMASLALNEDVIAAQGFGDLTGVISGAAAVGVFALVLWLSARPPRPSYWGAVWTTAATFLAYLFATGIAGGVHTGDPVLAVAVMGRLVTTGFALVVAAAALVSGWAGIALVHTHRSRPRWPWEHDDEP